MPRDDQTWKNDSPDPEPSETAGLTPGADVAQGDTPPNAGQMSGAAGDSRREAPNMGPVSGNRTPMIVALVVLGIMVLMTAIIVGASFVPS